MAPSFEIAREPRGPLQTIREAGRRRLPARYRTDLWDLRFRSHLGDLLRPGISVLDVGAGRRPTVPIGERPDGIRYVALDLEAGELANAEPGSYDQAVVSAAEEQVPDLVEGFDLVLSFFALEHVRSTAAVLENVRTYLRPGGVLLAQLAGARSPFSIANRVLPGRLSRSILRRTQGRDPDTVFPARYDQCTYSGLAELLGSWSHAEVKPLYTAAGYVLFSRVLTAGYVGYEEWIYRSGRHQLAPYYLVFARR